jgi:hypothetical protein
MENSIDTIGNQTLTFRLLQQGINQLRHGVHPKVSVDQ